MSVVWAGGSVGKWQELPAESMEMGYGGEDASMTAGETPALRGKTEGPSTAHERPGAAHASLGMTFLATVDLHRLGNFGGVQFFLDFFLVVKGMKRYDVGEG